ncbi:type VI secretion system baseplate subunit TssG [Citrobacter amalonaticus]|uniref:Type VI secretion system baseplate subunit TssG n=1 Tax=Citrobacter amalonaticus TaxID=35703 RepID=A0A2S4RQM1_CITAM|nr:type VI secretion system baseplate subunit TssG [Citrobacter amalonaticus]POT57515.1 type VI secretion system baseplate subunit TssG [Citrobacter amalonaticus]POT76958.1 type VI secretion system baseplate subunit TssG [Citrobacter amalonaticus]POU60211.1 type VI secretion system baseplate subunit TssG [Citrobacter amalonaticus]POV06193.1 type VI secretion system baseplate subunit TssG [Citrobacter amalonaticus]
MGRKTQPPHSRLSPRLESELTRINFYRFCQLLEKRQKDKPLLGSGIHPVDDPVRFCPHPGMGFPAGELKSVEYDQDNTGMPPVVRTTFMGMYGVDSPLPTTYLDDITQRREGHEALQGFLDIFSHRILTQFYRIWRKYSYPATFEAGGSDTISQSLLGLVGLGIPGTANHIATPVSRFLALLGVLRQPGKTQEGMQAMVQLLAPQTRVKVSPYCLRPVAVSQPLGFDGDEDFLLDGNTPLGDEAMDANSQLLIALATDNEQEAQGWKPDGQLYQDFLVMLRVYLGWRFRARITLTVGTALLAVPPLGDAPFWLGMNGVLGVEDNVVPPDVPQTFTTELGYYSGLQPATQTKGNRRVTYKFN